MTLPDDQRHLLAGFLRARREVLAPEAVGLPATRRRRTPGLRREEVAQLCNISTTWYTWVEQARDVSLSVAALGRVADGLRLTSAERAYLFELAQRRDPAQEPPPSDAPPQDLTAALQTIAAPAYLLDRLWRVCGHNSAAARLFSLWFESGEACLLRFIFLVPAAREFIRGSEDRARRVVAEFRADTARHPHDVALQSLARDMQASSVEFSMMWTSYAVLAREGGVRRFMHPQDGAVQMRQLTFVPATHPGHKLVLLLPD